jgi:hypothetical protein
LKWFFQEDNMKRTCALVVMAALICSNCAARGPALRVDGPLANLTGSPDARLDVAVAPQDPDIWRKYAARLPIASTVRIRTTSGEHFTAVLLVVDDAGVTVKPKTRIPEPARQVPFERLAELELAPAGSNIAKAAAIGGAVGAGVFFGLMMILFAGLD